jgi:iron-sulfur cluster assembly protein
MAVELTPTAVQRVAALKERRQTPTQWLRIGIRGGGCSGLSYFLDFVDGPEPKDKTFTFDNGVGVCVDRKSYLFLNGTEIDWQEGLLKTGFTFKNPTATGSCSCGESFTT